MLPTTNDLLGWALYYHARGYSVIPVDPETKKPCLPTWTPNQTERATQRQIREWFGKGKPCAMAVVLGAVSGNLGALDFDSQRTYEWWTTTHPELARTLPTERTARGFHVFFRCEPIPTQRPKGQKIELLCEGAYVILTPSPGKHWLNAPDGQLPEIDPFVLGLEIFGIEKPKTGTRQFTEETEETEEPEDLKIASLSSVSSVNSGLIGAEVQKKIDEAISRTLPTDAGQRNRCILTFCQWLKAIPKLRDRTAAQLKPVVQKWHA